MIWKFEKGLNIGFYHWYIGFDHERTGFKFPWKFMKQEEDMGTFYSFWRFYLINYNIRFSIF